MKWIKNYSRKKNEENEIPSLKKPRKPREHRGKFTMNERREMDELKVKLKDLERYPDENINELNNIKSRINELEDIKYNRFLMSRIDEHKMDDIFDNGLKSTNNENPSEMEKVLKSNSKIPFDDDAKSDEIIFEEVTNPNEIQNDISDPDIHVFKNIFRSISSSSNSKIHPMDDEKK